MKRIALILSLACSLGAPAPVRAAYLLPTSDNRTITLKGASQLHDGDLNTSSTGEQTGCMWPDYFGHGIYCLNPEHTNDSVYNLGASGQTPNGQAVTCADQEFAILSYNLRHGYATNQISNVGFSESTVNGNFTSNQMALAISNNLQALLTTTNLSMNTNEGGTSVSNLVSWVPFSDQPSVASDGGGTGAQSDWARMTAATNAGFKFGAGALDIYDRLLAPLEAYGAAGDNPPLEVASGPKAGHPRAELSLMIAFGFWMETQGTDTNINGAVLDYAAGSIVSTNHCVVTSISKSGNILTFHKTNLRQAPSWDIAGTVDLLGNVTTNDCSRFTQDWPAAGNFWQEPLTFNNLAAGTYQLFENHVLIKTFITPAGNWTWNMATNYVGPRWQQRAEGLGRYRDVENADRVSLVLKSGSGFVALGSLAFGRFPTFTGDALESQLDANISGIRTNSTGSFAAIRAEEQPQDYTYQLVPLIPQFFLIHR